MSVVAQTEQARVPGAETRRQPFASYAGANAGILAVLPVVGQGVEMEEREYEEYLKATGGEVCEALDMSVEDGE